MLIDTKTIVEIINTSDSREEMIDRIEELEKLIEEETADDFLEEEREITEDEVTENDINEWWDKYGTYEVFVKLIFNDVKTMTFC